MKSTCFLIGFLILSSLSSSALASWVSGGGSLDFDRNNPWFLVDNTSTVTYCIMIDEQNFGMRAAEVRPIIEEVFTYWRNELELATSQNGQGDTPSVGTYDYSLQISCDGTEDLAFQFGVLTPEQRARIPNPEKYVGLAIRTDYDLQTKKGSGFIYVGAEQGPLKMNAEDILALPWSTYGDRLLKFTLAHEFSHVLGFDHIEGIEMLRSGFPASTIASLGHETYLSRSLSEFAVVASHPESHELCRQEAFYQAFFSTPSDATCHRIHITADGLTVLYQSSSMDWQVAGHVVWGDNNETEWWKLWSPFRLAEGPNSFYVLTPSVNVISKSGMFTPTQSNATRTMHYRNDFRSPSLLMGEMDGKIYPDLLSPVL